MEKTVHSYTFFSERHLYKGGGTEFFTFGEFESSLQKVCDILSDFRVRFEVFTEDIFTERPDNKNKCEPLNMKAKIDNIEEKIILRPYQKRCLEAMIPENKGVLILPTGVGKTIIFLSYMLSVRNLRNLRNLVLVPTKKLVEQTAITAKDMGFSVSMCYSDNQNLSQSLSQKNLIISTYQSSKYLIDIQFNTIIFDECHTTVLSSQLKRDFISSFQLMLTEGKAIRKFFFTATEKSVSLGVNDLTDLDNEIFSMDNVNQYGKVLFRYRLDEAIMDGYLCDYNLDMIVTTDKTSSLISELNMKKGCRVFVYCSSVSKAEDLSLKIKNFIPKAYVNFLSGNTPKSSQILSLRRFREHKGLSVLCLCKLFIVGFNEPSIDMVVHYDRCNSVIELTQKNGRATRLYPHGKVRSTFVFMIEKGKSEDIRYYKKVMKKLILEDARLETSLTELSECSTENKANKYNFVNLIVDIPEYLEERTVYDRYVRRLCPTSDTEDEFNKLRRYVRNLNLLWKTEYRRRVSHDPVLVYEPDDYFGRYWTNWYDFLGLDTSEYPKTKNEWIKLCRSLGVSSWNNYIYLQKKNFQLPKMPQDMYIGFTNFDDELGLNFYIP